MNRNVFDIGTGTGSGTPLRNLATTISAYPCNQARNDCFFSAAPPPYNFLANGMTLGHQPIPAPIHCPLEIAKWKFNTNRLNCCIERGFTDGIAEPSCKGLSLIFDPLTDAFLAANAGISKGVNQPQHRATVIVLSDYGAIYDPDINLINYAFNDWGEDEANKFVGTATLPPKRKDVGKTVERIFDSICGGKAWETNLGLIERTIQKRNVLVWNFMPFMRGGGGSSSDAELPNPKCGSWRQTCINLLGDFLNIVVAGKVVICVNKSRMIPIPNGGASNPLSLVDWQRKLPNIKPNGLGHYINDDKVFVLNHPCSKAWKDSNNSRDLDQIANPDPPEPPDVLDRHIDE